MARFKLPFRGNSAAHHPSALEKRDILNYINSIPIDDVLSENSPVTLSPTCNGYIHHRTTTAEREFIICIHERGGTMPALVWVEIAGQEDTAWKDVVKVWTEMKLESGETVRGIGRQRLSWEVGAALYCELGNWDERTCERIPVG